MIRPTSPLGQVGNDDFAEFFFGRAIDNEAKCALRIVLADEHDGARKKRTAQPAGIEQELPLQKLGLLSHGLPQMCRKLAVRATWIKFAP